MKIDRAKTGRAKGTPNKITKDSREILFEIITNEINNLPSLLEELEPRERAYILTKLLPYILPKVTTAEQSICEPIIIEVPFNI